MCRIARAWHCRHGHRHDSPQGAQNCVMCWRCQDRRPEPGDGLCGTCRGELEARTRASEARLPEATP